MGLDAISQTLWDEGKFVRNSLALRFGLLVFSLSVSLVGRSSEAATLLFKDGRTLEGRYVELASVAENPLSPKAPSGEVALTPLILVDDGLRRTFIHRSQIRQVLDQNSGRNVRVNIWQQVAERGGTVGRIGRATRVTPFDEYGRRIYEMQSTEGPLSIVQGITQITPLYTKVEGLMGGPRPIKWDMRLATTSIPRDTLSRILTTSVKRDDLDGRLQVVSLYLQSERYRDAGTELEQIIKDFPERKDLEQEIRQLRQLGARLILKEIQLRRGAGQHQRSRVLLEHFPSEGVSGETLQQVREWLNEYTAEDARRKMLMEQIGGQVAKIGDENGRRLADEFAKEIAAELNEDAIKRLASFERLLDDAAMTPEQKVALAISGWLVGANYATDNFQVAVSLARVRDQVRAYLRDPLPQNRSTAAAELRDMEGATVERVAQILKLMKPPIETSKDAERGVGQFELNVSGIADEADFRYVVQLPPEYDPLRRYPTIVALADDGVSAEQMLDFWAGQVDKAKDGERLGQATRHGYITIAVDWRQPHQFVYDYSAREHHVVLGAVRDACRRFSVDTDRVFLTGHGIGGDAAWDIAIAHPDVWAGVIPICAVGGRYVTRYADNARYVAWYVVGGELDGDKMSRNAQQLDRYLKPNTDATVVEFLGRGYEPFGDEIQRLFDWMGRRVRTVPKEIDYVTLRPWDNFAWWLEVDGIPEKSMVAPASWPPTKGVRPFRFGGKVLATNRIIATAKVAKATVWLSPELVDFNEKLVVEVNNRPISPRDRYVKPDLNVLLDDARSRADRQHPFWAKLETGNGVE
jgi:pimeloyl-ACP methyl ester carboxylesterase